VAITTKPPYLGAGLGLDRATLGTLQSIIDRIEKARVAAVADIPAASTAAELKVNELLAALRTANILES
jgi:hypothetical protein